MISDKKKFIFVHIPKTGGTSIEIILRDLINEKCSIVGDNTYYSNGSLKHATAEELLVRYDNDKFNEYLKFCVIRNPWDRLLSLYYWGGRGSYSKDKFIKMLPKNKNNDCDLGSRTLWSVNKYICGKNNEILVDKILNFDTIEEDFNDLCEELGINVKLPHRNKGKHKTNFREVMDEETIELINLYYNKEIKMFWKNYLK